MGFIAFFTCGSCSSRRKRGHDNFPDTITIPTVSSTQPHNAALAHAHPYEVQYNNNTNNNTNNGTPDGVPQGGGGTRHPSSHDAPSSQNSTNDNRQKTRQASNAYPRVSSGRPRATSRPQDHQEPRRVPSQALDQTPSQGGKNRDAELTDKSRQVASRVLEQFQADPTLGRSRIPYSSLYFTRVLSKGAFGEVWLAQLENRQVAVKRILNEKKNDEREIECFGAEIKLMASFSHPKIVEFVGVSWSSMQDVCAVTEYMSKGDLYGFLKRRQGQLNWRDHKIYLAEDVADALGYLHGLSPKVIHRDLKSKNILLDDSFRAKLSDFGISRERSVEDTMTAGVARHACRTVLGQAGQCGQEAPGYEDCTDGDPTEFATDVFARVSTACKGARGPLFGLGPGRATRCNGAAADHSAYAAPFVSRVTTKRLESRVHTWKTKEWTLLDRVDERIGQLACFGVGDTISKEVDTTGRKENRCRHLERVARRLIASYTYD
uniref:Protein kinase domain-containing protein n=1 Tax=Hyaloperonospora arabidopsidis (strain Emoy2) TaxID=559515 RepID=M4BBJ4_HYAAE